MSLSELEQERLQNEDRLLELEMMYQRKKEMGTGKAKHNVSGFSGRGQSTERSMVEKKTVQIREGEGR